MLRHLLLAGMCAASLSSFAQINAEQPAPKSDTDHGHKIIYFGDGTAESGSSEEMISKFYFDQFRHAHDPLAPYFMFMSRDSKLALGIGGKFNATAYYDWNGTIDDNGFIPFEIPMSRDNTQRHRIGASVSESQLFLRLFGKSDRFGWYQLYIQAKFTGSGMNGYGFKLSKAYASVGDWTLGYASTTFADPAACPNTVDPQGPNAEVSETTFLIRYMHTFKGNHWSIAASVEAPDLQVPTYPGIATACNAYMPDFAAFGQYQWADGLYHVRLSGILRGLEYRDDITAENHRTIGWGAHLSAVANPLPSTVLYGGINAGKGIASLNNDLQCDSRGLDMLPSEWNPGAMHAAKSLAWYAALQYNFRPDLYSTVMFSEVRLFPGDIKDGGMYKYGLYGAANIFWNPTSRLLLGAEYDFGACKNLSGDRRWVNRIGLTCQYSF